MRCGDHARGRFARLGCSQEFVATFGLLDGLAEPVAGSVEARRHAARGGIRKQAEGGRSTPPICFFVNQLGSRLRDHRVVDHGGLIRRHELTDQEWELLAPLIPRAATGRPRVSDRQIINGMVYKIRTGISWRACSDCWAVFRGCVRVVCSG
ncbi:transposase [Streptomyces sp. NPDC054962]